MSVDVIDESTWLYNDYKVGDVVVFDIRMIHGSFRYYYLNVNKIDFIGMILKRSERTLIRDGYQRVWLQKV